MNRNFKLALILVGSVMTVFIGLFFKHVIDDSAYEKAKIYNTAVRAESDDQFNYAVDSRQGNVLASGQFSTVSPVVIADVSGEYFQIEKTKERYNQHTETYQCGTEENPQTCTRTYYSWDYAGDELFKADRLSFHGREYPSAIFSVGNTRWLGCENILVNCKGDYSYEEEPGWFGPSEGDVRYYYRVKDTDFFGVIIVNTLEGILKPIDGNLISIVETDIETAIKNANQIHGGTVFFGVWFLMALVACIVFIRVHYLDKSL